jgi:hypothetical protein
LVGFSSGYLIVCIVKPTGRGEKNGKTGRGTAIFAIPLPVFPKNYGIRGEPCFGEYIHMMWIF